MSETSFENSAESEAKLIIAKESLTLFVHDRAALAILSMLALTCITFNEIVTSALRGLRNLSYLCSVIFKEVSTTGSNRVNPQTSNVGGYESLGIGDVGLSFLLGIRISNCIKRCAYQRALLGYWIYQFLKGCQLLSYTYLLGHIITFV